MSTVIYPLWGALSSPENAREVQAAAFMFTTIMLTLIELSRNRTLAVLNYSPRATGLNIEFVHVKSKLIFSKLIIFQFYNFVFITKKKNKC